MIKRLMFLAEILVVAAAQAERQPISDSTRAATEKWVANRFGTAAEVEEHTTNTAIHLTPQQATKIAQAATEQYVNSAIDGIRFDEKDPAFWREYYYGDPDIMPSPTNWFTFTPTADGLAWRVSLDRQDLIFPDMDKYNFYVPYEHESKPVLEMGAISAPHSGIYAGTIALSVTNILGKGFNGWESVDLIRLPECKSIASDFNDNMFQYIGGVRRIELTKCEQLGNAPFRSDEASWSYPLVVVLGNIAPTVHDYAFTPIAGAGSYVLIEDPTSTEYSTTISDNFTTIPVIRPNLHTDALTLNGVTYTEIGGADPDPWQEVANAGAAVTITAESTRIRWTGAGSATLTLQGLTEGLPVYLVIQGLDSLTIAGAYWVGGGSYVPGMANHYIAWNYNGDLLINPITATEVQ